MFQGVQKGTKELTKTLSAVDTVHTSYFHSYKDSPKVILYLNLSITTPCGSNNKDVQLKKCQQGLHFANNDTVCMLSLNF